MISLRELILKLFKEYLDFIIFSAIAFDFLLTVYGAGNIYLLHEYEQNPGLSFLAGFESNTVFILGVLGIFTIQILMYSLLWFGAKKYNLCKEYLFLAIFTVIHRVVGVSTWFGGIPFLLDAWSAVVYGTLGNMVAKVLFIYITAMIIIKMCEAETLDTKPI